MLMTSIDGSSDACSADAEAFDSYLQIGKDLLRSVERYTNQLRREKMPPPSLLANHNRSRASS
jgi:hypothetical protein